jgi:hypothetical protein
VVKASKGQDLQKAKYFLAYFNKKIPHDDKISFIIKS